MLAGWSSELSVQYHHMHQLTSSLEGQAQVLGQGSKRRNLHRRAMRAHACTRSRGGVEVGGDKVVVRMLPSHLGMAN